MKCSDSFKLFFITAISIVGFGIQGYRIKRLDDSNVLSTARLNEVEAKIESILLNSKDTTEKRALDDTARATGALSESPFKRDAQGWWVADNSMFMFPKGIVVGIKNGFCNYGEATLSVNIPEDMMDFEEGNCPEGKGSVAFGRFNKAAGEWSAVLGGNGNSALGPYSSVSGGLGNSAIGDVSSVSGGVSNTASGAKSSVSGGSTNTASGDTSSVSGGSNNRAKGSSASIAGGQANVAQGAHSSLAGGRSGFSKGQFSSVMGGISNIATGYGTSVLGGFKNNAVSQRSCVAGGRINKTRRPYEVVS